MKSRNWRIRSKISVLVAVPLTGLVALWIFATTLTVEPAVKLLGAQAILTEIGKPGETLVAELQRERRLSVIALTAPSPPPALGEQRIRTDHAAEEFRRRVVDPDLRDGLDSILASRLDQLLMAMDTLPAGRGYVDRGDVDAVGAFGLYNGLIDSAFGVFNTMIVLPDEGIVREARALTGLGRAREVLARSDALLAGGFAAGELTAEQHRQLVQVIGTQRFLYGEATAELPDRDRLRYQRIVETEDFVQLRAMEDALLAAEPGRALPVEEGSWRQRYRAVQDELREFELTSSDALVERSRPMAVNVIGMLALAGLLGFFAVLATALIALRVGRSLIRRLTALRADAMELAERRLPEVMDQLSRGETIDPEQETLPRDYGDDEIGQVGKAFSEVQRTAVRAAVNQAALRSGLRKMFLNVARRSQTLLHRQLALVDRMERRATDPDELADLFRVDHLATRMRRHAEDLVILAGAAPGRTWRNPVVMLDVIRGAISEVEHYARVDVTAVAPAALTGRVVGDVIHLLAELVENATAFSPPHTRVRVRGRLVAGERYAVEVEDCGLGMTDRALAEANERLATPDDFDPANSARLGLFVVAQLAARHGIEVRLRTSPYGGVTAAVTIPAELLTGQVESATAEPGTVAGALRWTGGADVPGGDGADASRASDAADAPSVTAGEVLPRRRAIAGDGGGTMSVPVVGGSGADDAPAPIGQALPRRIRQQHLAPQLRTPRGATVRDSVATRAAGGGRDRPGATRTPEEIRAVMAALQAGTERGRRDAEHVAGRTEPVRVGDPDPTNQERTDK
jgi:signal transduction histidine kinase